MTAFVEMFHPLIASTITTPARVAVQAVDERAAQGWLLVDPDGVLPDPVTPYYTKEALLSQIQGGAAPIGAALRAAFVTPVDAGANLDTARPSGAAIVYWLFDAGVDVGDTGENVVHRQAGDLIYVADA